jgi:hypothetical protein
MSVRQNNDSEGAGEAADRRAAVDEVIVECLAQGGSYRHAASVAGCSVRTVARRMSEQDFARRVSVRRQERVTEITGELTNVAAEAVAVIRRCLDAEQTSDQLRAANMALSLVLRFRGATEMEARIAELEARADAAAGLQAGGAR